MRKYTQGRNHINALHAVKVLPGIVSFNHRSAWIRLEKIHIGEKPYQCITFDKGFTHSSHLIQHERIHTEEKPYHCSTCGKGFNQSNHMTSHERTRCQL